MIDLSTDYPGLRLKNPLVPHPRPRARTLDTLLRLEEAVPRRWCCTPCTRSELIAEDAMTERFLLHLDVHDGESAGFLPDHGIANGALERYLSTCSVRPQPSARVIASLTGVTLAGWVIWGGSCSAGRCAPWS